MLGCNPQRSNYTDEQIEFPYEFAWKKSFVPQRVDLNCQPVVAGGLVFVGTKSGNLYALEARTGKEVWKYEAGGIIEHTAGADGGRVFIACLDGTVHAVKLKTGEGLWVFRAGSGFSASVLPVDGKVFIGARDGNFYALDQADGAVVWSIDLGAPVFQSAAWNNGRVYIGAEDMRMRCLDGRDGRQLWISERLYGQSFRQFHPVIAGNSVAVMVMGIDMGLRGGPGVFQWYPADAFHNKEEGEAWWSQTFEALAKGEGVNDRMMADQEAAIELLRNNPEWQLLYILNESDGKQRYIAPSWRGPSQGGPACPPARDAYGLLIVPVFCFGLRYGRLDIEKGRIVDVLIPKKLLRLDSRGVWQSILTTHKVEYAGGAMDEMETLSCAGPLIFYAHPLESAGQPTGTFDLRTRIFVEFMPVASTAFTGSAEKTPFIDNTLTRGQPFAIADGMFFHNSYGQIRAWRGANPKKGEEQNQ